MKGFGRKSFSFFLVLSLVFALLSTPVLAVAQKKQTSAQSKTRTKNVQLKTKYPQPKTNYVQDEILIKAKPGKKINKSSLEAIGASVVQTNDKSGIQRIKLPKNKSVDQALKEARSNSDIQYAEPNYINKLDFVPNDTYWSQQWALQTGKVDAVQAWDISQGSSAITVAVIDSGVDGNHPDLQGKIVNPYNAMTGESGSAAVHDDVGHGTHVAGIIGASLNNQIGVAGLGGNVKVMPIKAGDANGLTDANVINAIHWAVDSGVRVINMSFGGYDQSSAEQDAVNYALQHNVVVVAAAGNDGTSQPHYPSGYPGVISVAATDNTDHDTAWSNWGKIDVSAPGVDILSTLPTYQTNVIPGLPTNYGLMSGTSMASPEVAGLAALILSKNPSFSNTQVSDMILRSADDVVEPGRDPYTGTGRINAYKALLADQVGVKYQGHVQNIGWQPYVYDGDIAGTVGLSYRVEALKIQLVNAPEGLRVKYRAHVQNIGWQDWVYDGAEAGTDGQSLRVEAIQAQLEGPGAENYRIVYQAQVQNIGWQPWVAQGQTAGTSGQSLRVEALRFKIIKVNTPSVIYQGHVQNIGWQGWVKDGDLCGTQGLSYRVEGFMARLENFNLLNLPDAHIVYQAHVQNIGWMPEVSDGTFAGTSGQSLRIEALKIHLVNAPGYSIQYQAHVQNFGWQPWVSDGQEAGTDGQSLRIEAIRIKIVKTP